MITVKPLYIILIVFFIFTSGYSKEMEFPKITILEYNKHTFLYFNESQIIHDPDCRCSLKWEGFMRNKNDEIYNITLYRSITSDHD